MENLIKKYEENINKIEIEMKEIETRYENKEVPRHKITYYNNLEFQLSVLTKVVIDIKNAL